jgi:hypothetical protein
MNREPPRLAVRFEIPIEAVQRKLDGMNRVGPQTKELAIVTRSETWFVGFVRDVPGGDPQTRPLLLRQAIDTIVSAGIPQGSQTEHEALRGIVAGVEHGILLIPRQRRPTARKHHPFLLFAQTHASCGTHVNVPVWNVHVLSLSVFCIAFVLIARHGSARIEPCRRL